MNIRFLETFVWVARLRSFSVAADKLFSTQAAVSNRIATLEKELGVRLFDRDVRSVKLTLQGQRALEGAEDIVRRVSEFQCAIADCHTVRGTVQLGTSDSLVYAWIPRLIRRMNEEYPNVCVNLTVGASLHIARDIQDGRVDLGLIMGPIIAPGLCNEALCSYESVWVASPNLSFPEHALTLKELAAYPLLSFSVGSMPHVALQRLARDAGLHGEKLRIFNTNSVAANLRLVIEGTGVSALPRPVVQAAIERGEVRELKTVVKMPALDFHAVHADRPGDYLTALVARMAVEIANSTASTSRSQLAMAPVGIA